MERVVGAPLLGGLTSCFAAGVPVSVTRVFPTKNPVASIDRSRLQQLSMGFLQAHSRGFAFQASAALLFPKCVMPKDMIRTWKIAPGDDVRVLSGKDKEKEGVVLAVDKRRNMVKVKGCNLQMLRDKSGHKVQVERKIHYSNVNLLDPVTREATRTCLNFQPDGAILRIAKKSGQVVPWPERKVKPFDTERQKTYAKDTEPHDALEKTYSYRSDVTAMRLARQSMTKYNHDL
ncbi:unnamed protein product [Amoebophrya sp. A120]|nr:unnamed protein product [Amoebophrya sp. A120]|eukprot:GSA120T00001985001.1